MPAVLAAVAIGIAWLFFTDSGEGITDTVVSKLSPGHVQKSLSLLQPDFRAKVEGYMADMSAAGMPLFVTETLRTQERQDYLFDVGASHTHNSAHRAQDPDGLARGVDTLPVGFEDTPEGNNRAVLILQSSEAILLRAKWGLKNLPSIQDYGHLEDAS